MATYLFQVGYTADGWTRLIESPHDRMEAVKPAIEQLGGTLIAGWFSFGEYDIVAIADLPDNVSAASFSIAAAAGGVLRTIKTTPLLSMEEGIKALERAKSSAYAPPPEIVHA